MIYEQYEEQEIEVLIEQLYKLLGKNVQADFEDGVLTLVENDQMVHHPIQDYTGLVQLGQIGEKMIKFYSLDNEEKKDFKLEFTVNTDERTAEELMSAVSNFMRESFPEGFSSDLVSL